MKLHKEDLEKIETEILKELSPACYEYYKKTLKAKKEEKWLQL
tara:strand:+ start:40 stop:168 length:129 start_codon:yes stop_codon:yes gene_type:complete